MAKKTVKKSVSAKPKAVKKSAKKVTKKAVKKTPKKPAKKIAKKVLKTVSKKTVKKASPKKVAKKVSKKVTKKVTKKAVKKVVKKVANKVEKKVVKKITETPPSKNVETDVYKIDFHVYGYGKENCVAEMTDAQYKYWKAKFADEDSDAQSELSDHLWNFDYDEEAEDTHFGKWYDQDDVLHEEKAYYSDSSVLNVTVYKNGEYVDEITRNVTYKGLEKSFYDEFVPNKKDNKGKGYLYTGAVDRGAYCEGSFELEPGEVFDEKKLSIIVGKVFNQQFVWDICYGDYGILDDEGCQSSTGKGFDVDVYFF